MIAATFFALALTAAAPSPSPQPSASPSSAPALPSIDRALAIPYPASGTTQPQIVQTRPEPGVPTLITLDQATALAIARVPSLAAARAEVDVEDAAVRLTRTGLAPDLSLSASSTQYYAQAGATPGSASGQSNTAAISLAQLIFDGGHIRAEIEAASFTRDATLAQYRRDAQTVAYAAASNYYAVLEDERTVAVDEELVRQDVVSEALVRAQIRAGTVAGSDLDSQLATTANARSTLVIAQGTLQNDRIAFATSLGLDADIDVLPKDDAQGLETATPPMALPAYASALKIAYVERPDVDEAQLTIRSSEASVRAARRGSAPSLSLAANKGLTSSNAGGGFYRNNGNVGLDLTLPIYDRGATRANVASARATLAVSTADAATTKLDVQQQVRQALVALVSDRATLDQTRAAYTAALTALRATQGKYRAGVGTLPDLIQAEASLASAAVNIVNAIYTLRLAQTNLRYALGTILQ
jgi:outer membrane protein TolC